MYDDTNNNGKTTGETVAHNMSSISTGVGTTALIGLFTSTPVGWGAVALGVGATIAFEFAYETNFYGLQDGLDWLGNVGEALHNSWDVINPFSW
ncbi:hypothetical protein [Oceanobacillus jeddahense]|uniref:Uncharacterized protein n=1 Tax=Oceanobacillus jeddahense TaxID=1462527 RepID=A0ABY5JXV4_9BACI|nr:hypothetical protein [Oceanobacillus jeddahense]UUI05222.1 hypothetical protein NP439_11510 [Oceanobacillus jeddahense]